MKVSYILGKFRTLDSTPVCHIKYLYYAILISRFLGYYLCIITMRSVQSTEYICTLPEYANVYKQTNKPNATKQQKGGKKEKRKREEKEKEEKLKRYKHAQQPKHPSPVYQSPS